MKTKVDSTQNGSKQSAPESEPRQKAAPPTPKISKKDAERVVLRTGPGSSLGHDATIGDLLSELFFNDYEHPDQPLAEAALRAIGDDLFVLASLADPTNDTIDIEMVQQEIYLAAMRARGRALAAAELSARVRKSAAADDKTAKVVAS